MAQSNSEYYREEKVGSSPSVGTGEGEKDVDLRSVGELREPPSSQVGYGGGDDRYHGSAPLRNEGSWEERPWGNSDEDSRFGQDMRGESDSGMTEVQQGATSGYGSVERNAKPSEAEFGSSGRGGYQEEESHSVGSYGDVSSKSSGTYGRGDIEGSSAGYGSEVRNGVPHRVTSDGFASGVGISNGLGDPTSDDIEQHRYHLTEAAPSSEKSTPYSQAFTQHDGPAKGGHGRFDEEDISGNTRGGTAVDHNKDAENPDHSENDKFLSRLMHKLPGNGHKQEGTDSNSDITASHSDIMPQEDQGDKPGVVKTLKEKMLPNRKHRDEIDPEIFK